MHSFLRRLRYLIRRTLLLVRLLFTRKNGLSHFRSVLVIAPHPDDEVIGLGGYLVNLSETLAIVTIVYLSDGEKSLEDIDPERVKEQRHRLSLDVLDRLGVSSCNVRWLHCPDGSIPLRESDGFDDAVGRIAGIIREVRPDAVFVTHPLDTWPSDHIAAYDITSRALDHAAYDCALFGYWVWLWYSMPAWSSFLIKWRNISRISHDGMHSRKMELMDAYILPLAPNGKPWSGVLPGAMLKAFDYPFDVVERFR